MISLGLPRLGALLRTHRQIAAGSVDPGAPEPQVEYLSLADAIAAVEPLIARDGWVAGDKGLRLWQVAPRIENTAYVNIYDALHDMKRREYLVTTKAPSGSHTMFGYVRP